MEREAKHWYALNVRYLKADKFAALLDAAGLEHFIPPQVNNLLFIRSTCSSIDGFRNSTPEGSRLSYMRSRDYSPIFVSESSMQTFITICRVCQMPVVMTTRPVVRLGDRVRVKEGPLAGLEGHVVRIRKQKRILINIDNVVWAATGHIAQEELEILP